MSFIHETAMRLIARLQSKEEGQGLIEYGLTILLVAIALMATLTLVAGDIGGLYSFIGAAL